VNEVISSLVHSLIVASPSTPMTNRPDRITVMVHVTHLNSQSPRNGWS